MEETLPLFTLGNTYRHIECVSSKEVGHMCVPLTLTH